MSSINFLSYIKSIYFSFNKFDFDFSIFEVIIWFIIFRSVIKLKATIFFSPILFNISGLFKSSLKYFLTAVKKYFSSEEYSFSIVAVLAPMFDVKIINVWLKSIISPCEDVNLPSSNIWRNLSSIFPLAFSISSNKRIEKGFSLTLFVSSPPASYPT